MEDEERKARQREYGRRYRAAHPEREREAQRRYRETHRDEIRARNRERSSRYYREHRDSSLERQHAYYAANRDKILEQKKIYRASHIDERMAYDEARWRRQEQEYRVWLDALRTTQGCAVCGRKDGKLDFHHKDPESKEHSISGMAHYPLDAIEEELEKCVILCRKCHGQAHGDMEAGKTPAYEQATEEVECV